MQGISSVTSGNARRNVDVLLKVPKEDAAWFAMEWLDYIPGVRAFYRVLLPTNEDILQEIPVHCVKGYSDVWDLRNGPVAIKDEDFIPCLATGCTVLIHDSLVPLLKDIDRYVMDSGAHLEFGVWRKQIVRVQGWDDEDAYDDED